MNEHEVSELVPVAVEKKAAPRKRAAPKPKEAIQAVVQTVPVQAPVVLTYEQQRKQELKEKNERMRAHHAKLVTGKFLFNECPGGELKFAFREFPGDPLVKYTMRHDTVHTIPLGVAKHLNNRCSYPEYQHNLDNGKAVASAIVGSDQRIEMYIMSKVHRTNFIPLDFTEDADYNSSSLAQVKYGSPQSNQYSLDSLGR